MTEKEIIETTASYVKDVLSGAEGVHDWWHIFRVWNNAKHIASSETGVHMFIVELGSLLHDITDSKFNNGDEEIGPRTARHYLESLSVEESDIEQVEKTSWCVTYHSKDHLKGKKWTSRELAVVQDADRLDAIGAIGIARAFNYGGHIGRPLYDPTIPPNLNITKEQYKNSVAPTLNHSYEKLLLLKGLMNTKTGKEITLSRQVYMETFLEQFYAEWDGVK